MGPSDEDIVTHITYHADGGIETLTAKNADTGDQVTRYVYGVTLSESHVARTDLLRAEIYPDSDDTHDPLGNGPDGIYDRREFRYNRLRQRVEIKDQRETVRAIDYDLLGRPNHDRATMLGTGVDGRVRRISIEFNTLGLPASITSHDDASIGSGTVLNEVRVEYDDFGQRAIEYQEHSGPVNTSTTPKMQYTHADGSDNHARLLSMVYPGGRTVAYSYGATGSDDDAASRVFQIEDGGVFLAQYSYLGERTTIEAVIVEPDLMHTLANPAGTDDPDTGDIYSGLDRFGRIKDSRWRDYVANTDIERTLYDYDRVGNPRLRETPLDPTDSHDELYARDGAHRLVDFKRGDLTTSKSEIDPLSFAQAWDL